MIYRLQVWGRAMRPILLYVAARIDQLVQHAASRQFYDAPQFSDGWWTLVENIATVMADHRQNMVITPLMELIAPRAEGGHLAYDFSNLDG
jgi:hypothetical protein